jgi:NADPH:quinone reductase-like Zn-dependent oxidoreductase
VKAAVVTGPGKVPVYREFEPPLAIAGEELISVRASALSEFSRSRASGSHYSSNGGYPAVAGSDGVGITQDGRRVYFVLPRAPFGALAEQCPVRSELCVPLPASLDEITAAAIANPGMSAWTGLVERAHLLAGETVLVNGATGTAGRLAVQLAKHLGAGRIIATGRNERELREVRELGADVVVPFSLGPQNPAGAEEFEQSLTPALASGVNVVIDYLWGESAQTVIVAIAKAAEDATPVRFVHVGGASREETIQLPGAALRSSAILLMGSGVNSVPLPVLLRAIRSVFDLVGVAGLKIATRVVPLSEVERTWATAGGRPRVVLRIGEASARAATPP